MILLPGTFPPDIRVEKEARELIKAGHDVHLVCEAKPDQLANENVSGINVHRIHFNRETLLKRVTNTRFALNLFWIEKCKKEIEKIIEGENVKVIHVHDLPFVLSALSVAKRNTIPTIFDMHENWPEAMRVHDKKSIYEWITMNVTLHKIIEKYCVKKVNHIIVVVDEQKERLIKLGVPSKKITVVMNTEDLNMFDDMPLNKSLISKYVDNFIILYVGGFGPHRGIDTAIKSMPKILKEIPDAKLLLVGGKSSKEYGKELKKLCEELKVENNVEFTGWVDFSLVPSYIALSDVCLVPHHASGHTDTTIPHKLFQYMAMRKPVIVTDCKPLKRIVEECDCGIVVPSGDYNKMAEAVIRLYKDKEYARKLGENGRRAVEEKYNWENEAKKLCEVYKRLEE